MTLNPRQFQQLPMFMPAHEVLSDLRLGDQTGGSKENLMYRKHNEAIKSGLDDDIRENGIKEPLMIEWVGRRKPMLYEGHHRLASALDQDPNTEVPVTHVEVSQAFHQWRHR